MKYAVEFTEWVAVVQLSEVCKLHELLNPAVNSRAVCIYVDSWGLKRLATLAMARWKSPIAAPRVPSLNY